MARRRENKPISIDVEPFLSIMAIVLKLVTLILVVIAFRIAVNPHSLKIVAISALWDQSAGNMENPKVPSYIDCQEDGVVLYPGEKHVTWVEMQRPGSEVEKLLDAIQAKREIDYIVVMVRPKSVKVYRTIRSMIGKRPIDVGYDVVDTDFKVNWDEASQGLAVGE